MACFSYDAQAPLVIASARQPFKSLRKKGDEDAALARTPANALNQSAGGEASKIPYSALWTDLSAKRKRRYKRTRE